MEKSIIGQIFNGEAGRYDLIKDSKEVKELLSESDIHGNSLRAALKNTPELKELFEKVVKLEAFARVETAYTHYIAGFKIGLQIGLESSKD